ncbi:PP2C family protein-serine/threonine phosphatase [Peterkaempfera bronchialis]|uniref:PPM-type phosphatase domain-containing protein n=1 Tax=Peterkaempfera bronchialis TaxID=2126346 RepID=A0A345SSD0_9ACTN|nr:SpoIIE family protein phosphatase [Peterkaempfera bronchialis]AXI76635.1 hypothetical protein C7M71_003285 [Peterkaempfera bronchialis]
MHPAAHPDHPAVLGDGPGAVAAPYAPGIAVWDLTTDEVHWSPEVFALFGRDRTAGALTLDQLPAYLLPDDQLPVQGMVTAALVDGRALRGEFRVVRPDGTVRAVRCTGGPVIGPDGHAESLRLSLRDAGGAWPLSDRAAAASARPVAAPAAAVPDLAVRGPADTASGWCDALPLPGGGALLALGSGAAESAMLRDALRGMAMTGAGPAVMLGLLDRLLRQCGGSTPVAALCCRYEPGEPPALAWGQAGLRPPLLFRDGRVQPTAAEDASGAPLGGTAEPGYGERRTALRPGDVVLCWAGDAGEAEAAAVEALGPRLGAARTAADCADLALDLLGQGSGSDSAEAHPGGVRLVALRLG